MEEVIKRREGEDARARERRAHYHHLLNFFSRSKRMCAACIFFLVLMLMLIARCILTYTLFIYKYSCHCIIFIYFDCVRARVHRTKRFLLFFNFWISLKCNFICIHLSTTTANNSLVLFSVSLMLWKPEYGGRTIQNIESRKTGWKTLRDMKARKIFFSSFSVQRVSRQANTAITKSEFLFCCFSFGCCLLVSVNYLWRFGGGYQLLCVHL